MDALATLHLPSSHVADPTPLKLIVQPGDREIELTRQDAIVGRHATADVRLDYPEISRQHCRLTFANGSWWVIDLNSRNGIWVNGEHLREAAIYDGDCLRVGLCEITVLCGAPCITSAPAYEGRSAVR